MAEQTYEKNSKPVIEESPEKNPRRKLIIIAVIVLLALGSGLFYWHSTYSEDTDDAQVDGDLYQVSSRITGQVVKVYVEDNQEVKAGDVLAEIDPTDYQVALEQAEANLASAKASAEQASVNVPITSVTSRTSISTTGSDAESSAASLAQSQKQVAAAAARVDQAKANSIKSDLDVQRYKPLVERDVISKQQFDAAVAQADANKAAVLEAEAQLIAQQDAVRMAQHRLDLSRSQAVEAVQNAPGQVKAQVAKAQSASADVKEAQAKVDQAKLNLGYTKITAPVSGIVNKKNVQVGVNLSVGQDLLTIIPLNNLWVTANFKETQLEKMRPGQKVVVEVDALGGKKFHGTVTQIGGATGSKLSLFPPENATGNYVKVVQRIPVRVDFTNLEQENSDHKLRPGFSVTPVVSVK
ncbi:HlyD family secretion protein [Edaphobacter bradus]|uniref:HlyD family secretion protein n=1 Tax=Edaphobacter bradus TaxID=2259016 RepID=UPI0021E02177|nr:HlyD family secretion protein [Edaphobacter bradus]